METIKLTPIPKLEVNKIICVADTQLKVFLAINDRELFDQKLCEFKKYLIDNNYTDLHVLWDYRMQTNIKSYHFNCIDNIMIFLNIKCDISNAILDSKPTGYECIFWTIVENIDINDYLVKIDFIKMT